MPDQRAVQVQDLSVHFATSERVVDAVRNLSFHVDWGETLAVVGESGSSESVTSLALVRLVEHGGDKIIGGQMHPRRCGGEVLDLANANPAAMCGVRGADTVMIFQEPIIPFNPMFAVGEQITESIRLHQGKFASEAEVEALRMLELMRVPRARNVLGRHPHQLLGGMHQRMMIAMALSCKLSLLIMDESITALDVIIQTEILQLTRALQWELHMAVVFIAHDMGVAAEVTDRVPVMYKGDRAEEDPLATVFV